MKDLRDAYFERLLELMNAEDAPPSMILSVDMGAKTFKEPHHVKNARIVNVGVSEQNAVSMAAGLSSRGIKPFVYGISAFLLNRARAQIRHDAVIGHNPIHLIGSGPGLSYGRDGPSHHCLDDITLMRTLPDTVIYSPYDQWTAEWAAHGAMLTGRTSYCRLDKGSYPDLSGDLKEYLATGLSYRARYDSGWIVCSGVATHEALRQANLWDHSVVSLKFITNETPVHLANLIPRGAQVAVVDESSSGVLQIVAEANMHGHGMGWRLGQGQGLANKIVQEKLPRADLYGAYSR